MGSQHRVCEINAEDVPHLIIKDRSDVWKTNTLLKLPIKTAEDDDLMCHMVELCTKRKKIIEEISFENKNLHGKLENVVERNENLASEFEQAQRQFEHNTDLLKHEHALKISELKRAQEITQRELMQENRIKQDRLQQELSNIKESLSATEKHLEEI